MYARRANLVCLAPVLVASAAAWAHCDGLDGPVVKAAQQALEAGDANLVLIWVQPDDEAEVNSAFEKCRAVRALSPDARQLADTWFFETLVRLHRAGEGAPYTGLKPAGRDLGPAIPAADRAVADGSVDALVELVVSRVRDGIRERFAQCAATQDFGRADLPAGRAHVRAYVSFLHYIEGIYDAAGEAGHGHPEQTAHERLEGAEIVRVHQESPQAHPHEAAGHATLVIPAALKQEHEELHMELVRATKLDGPVGDAARNMAQVLHPHFVKEEEYALPPLGLLSAAAAGKLTPEMRAAIPLSDRLREQMPQMLAEH